MHIYTTIVRGIKGQSIFPFLNYFYHFSKMHAMIDYYCIFHLESAWFKVGLGSKWEKGKEKGKECKGISEVGNQYFTPQFTL